MPPRPSTGSPQALIYRIEYLQKLLKHLPLSLPLDPEDSAYRFYLDEDRVAEAGTVFPEAGRALEISFGTWKRDVVLKFEERGARVMALAPFLKAVVKRMSAGEREAFENAWIERLIKAAKESGAVVPSSSLQARERDAEDREPSDQPPPKKTRVDTPIILDSDDDMPPSIQTPSDPCVQQTRAQGDARHNGLAEMAPRSKRSPSKKATESHRQVAADTLEKKERNSELKRERERILGAERQRRFREKKRLEKEGQLSDDDNTNVVLMRRADAEAKAQEQQVDVCSDPRVLRPRVGGRKGMARRVEQFRRKRRLQTGFTRSYLVLSKTRWHAPVGALLSPLNTCKGSPHCTKPGEGDNLKVEGDGGEQVDASYAGPN
ncbi:hypothetical protein B0H14DRAFT_2648180 [Mycena olivaceomarginata]|nr:hypothetical protein B0H14DRAFT_2648180 [Mycena olivaceomarginata]